MISKRINTTYLLIPFKKFKTYAAKNAFVKRSNDKTRNGNCNKEAIGVFHITSLRNALRNMLMKDTLIKSTNKPLCETLLFFLPILKITKEANSNKMEMIPIISNPTKYSEGFDMVVFLKYVYPNSKTAGTIKKEERAIPVPTPKKIFLSRK